MNNIIKIPSVTAFVEYSLMQNILQEGFVFSTSCVLVGSATKSMDRLNVVAMMVVVRHQNLWANEKRFKKRVLIYSTYVLFIHVSRYSRLCHFLFVVSFCFHILLKFDSFFLLTVQGAAQQQASSDCLYCLRACLHFYTHTESSNYVSTETCGLRL